MSFDLFACYLDTLGPEKMESECRNTIKRVAFPSKPATVIAKIAKKLYVDAFIECSRLDLTFPHLDAP